MKILNYFPYSILFIVLLVGCKPKVVITELPVEEQLVDTVSQTFHPDAAFYSPDVLYVIAREYEAIHDSSTVKYDLPRAKQIRKNKQPLLDYMESRLVELYPGKAYTGMLSNLTLNIPSGQTFSEQLISVPNNEISFTQNRNIRQTDPFYFYVSDEDEMNFMQMTAREREKFQALNRVATMSKFADSVDFIEIRKMDSLPLNMDEEDKGMLLEENVLLTSALLLNGGAYLVYRVKLSKERSMYEAKRYYQDNTSCGKKGDAFKHMYVNMMLRRYLTENLAYLVMDVFWESKGSNSPCDKYMDLHNNYVGRHTQYSTFRGDLKNNDWRQWSQNIHYFVEDSINSIEKPWNKQAIEYNIIKDKEKTDTYKYIFWNKTSLCE